MVETDDYEELIGDIQKEYGLTSFDEDIHRPQIVIFPDIEAPTTEGRDRATTCVMHLVHDMATYEIRGLRPITALQGS
jgi:hypothetical protein